MVKADTKSGYIDDAFANQIITFYVQYRLSLRLDIGIDGEFFSLGRWDNDSGYRVFLVMFDCLLWQWQALYPSGIGTHAGAVFFTVFYADR